MKGMYTKPPVPMTLTHGDSITFKVKYDLKNPRTRHKHTAVGTVIELCPNNPWLVGVQCESTGRQHIVDTTDNKEI